MVGVGVGVWKGEEEACIGLVLCHVQCAKHNSNPTHIINPTQH